MSDERTNSDIAIRQAELILKLYDLRRESVMREARSYIGGEFLPTSAEELVNIVTSGTKHGAFVLQVYGYWDMVAAFVHNGALTPRLVYDTCQEMYFQYAKIQPYLADFRQKMNLPEWMISIEQLIEGSDSGRARLATMQKNLASLAASRTNVEKPETWIVTPRPKQPSLTPSATDLESPRQSHPSPAPGK